MKRFISSFLIFAISVPSAFAGYSLQDIQKIRNDKEPLSRVISRNEFKKFKEEHSDSKLSSLLPAILHQTFYSYLNSTNTLKCEVDFIKRLKSSLKKNKLGSSKNHIEDYLKILRVNNEIDDILYSIITEISQDYHGYLSTKPTLRIRDFSNRQQKVLSSRKEIKEYYALFSQWPDAVNNCPFDSYYELVKLSKAKDKDYKKQETLKQLNNLAFDSELIDETVYSRLEYLRRKGNLNKKYIWLRDYLEITFHAKNKMIPLNYQYEFNDIAVEDDFSTEKVQRLKKLTRRRLLYQKYNATQILMLADIMLNASRRMGVDPDTETGKPVITQEFSVLQPDGTRENYVERVELTEQEQYNLARKRLRKDMTALQMMDTFLQREVSYEDIVLAAFEAGYISFEDLEVVIAYDDLWNEEITAYERIFSFVFTGLGFATFYIPPPYNAVATLGLLLVQGLINNRNFRGSRNDNPDSLID